MATFCSDHVYFVQPATQLNARNVLFTVAFYPTLLIILDKSWSLWLVLLYLYQRGFVKFSLEWNVTSMHCSLHTPYLFSSARPRLSKKNTLCRERRLFIMKNRQKTTLVPSHSISYTRLYINLYIIDNCETKPFHWLAQALKVNLAVAFFLSRRGWTK